MKTFTILIAAALFGATPAHAKPFMCVLFPKSCIEPTAAPEPAPPPAAVTKPPVVAKPAAKPLPRVIRPKYTPAPAKARRKHTAVPSWCTWVPAGTSIARMQTEAKSRGIAWTPQAHAQARACLNSKKG